MSDFNGTVALISGGARGMGASHAKALVSQGAKVVIGDILAEEGQALAQELGDAGYFVHLDVTDENAWQAAVTAAEDAFGAVNLLINNAGIVTYGTVADMDLATFRRTIDINLIGVFLGMHAAVPSLRKAGGGTIINISSTAGMMGYAQIGAYVASKWAVRGLTKTAAMELGKDNIRVVSIHPGPIRTPMTQGMDDEMTQTQPISRFGEPQEVTEMVLFLAKNATYSTGSEFIIDGGALLGPVMDLQ